MSTFNGIITEIPHILVDNFEAVNFNKNESKNESTTFFLSHGHTDHMRGFWKKNDDQITPIIGDFIDHLGKNKDYKLYCTKLTKSIIFTLYPKLKILDSQIEVLVYGDHTIDVPEPKETSCTQSTLNVCVIPANHCTGDAMFLFKLDGNKNILYTGDFRYTDDHWEIIKYYFHNKSDSDQLMEIQKIYLDCTFCDPKYWAFPDTEIVIVKIIEEIKGWLNKKEQNNVVLSMPANFGLEKIICSVSPALFEFRSVSQANFKLCVHKNVYTAFENLDLDIENCITNDCSTTRVHSHGIKDKRCPFWKIGIKSAPFLNEKGVAVEIKRDGCTRGHPDYCDVMFNYASHSSYTETVKFLKYLMPNQIHACTGVHQNAKISVDGLTETLKEIKKNGEPNNTVDTITEGVQSMSTQPSQPQ